MSITIDSMQPAHAPAVGRLHAVTITEGFLLRLGERFLAELYRGVAADHACRVWVAADGDRVVGFCAYARDVSGMYRRILRRRWLRLGLASLPASLNPFVLKEVLDTLRYPAKQGDLRLPPAELLSIGVDASTRGTGAGRRLLEMAVAQAAADGQPEIKVLAGAKLDGANRFYSACGFEKRAEIVQHGEILNVYVKSTGSPGAAAVMPADEPTKAPKP